MKSYYENKLTYNGISFFLSDNPIPDEREIHSYHEILYFIEGEAELLTENSRRELVNGSLLIIPRETYHFVRLRNANFLRLKISVPKNLERIIPLADLMEGFRVIERLPEGVLFVLNRMLRIMNGKDGEKNPFYAYAAFLMLIEEIDTRVDEMDSGITEKVGVVTKIIHYISQNLAGDLSAATIAASMNISVSGLIHSFKNELGISLHSYITQRRLLYAHELILMGHKPSKIYLDCGYMEYSSFYRAYVNFFGCSPSKEKKDLDQNLKSSTAARQKSR
jgi:AraC-like DNA-binding protein